MTCCAHCRAIEGKFGRKAAQSDRNRYRRRGPEGTAGRILGLLGAAGTGGDSLLDVGGGIGIIVHELLARGVGSAVLVDASPAYLEAAEEVAQERGIAGRLRLLHGDFVEVARQVDPADVVTLDRVVCCYPDYRRLLAAAADRCRAALAFSYPSDRWYVRLVTALQNLGRRLARDPFRTFVHPEKDMQRVLAESGLRLRDVTGGLVWRVAVYTREAASPSLPPAQ
jgi:magnesium-protoporphyrin O-methyltransferase